MTLSIKKVNKTRPWALKVSYTMICYFYLQTTVAFAVFRLMSCFVVYRRVRGKTENMKVYGCACVFIVCFMYRSWWLCSFPTQWERVRQSVVQAARLKTPLKAEQTKWRQFRGLQAPLAFGHIFAACHEMSFCLLYNFKLPEEGLVFVHTLRLTYSTLTHQTPTLQNIHSVVVRRAVKDEIYRRRSST